MAKSVRLRKEHKSKTGGLTKKGRDKINRETGSNLKAPVTGKVKPGSAAAKRSCLLYTSPSPRDS